MGSPRISSKVVNADPLQIVQSLRNISDHNGGLERGSFTAVVIPPVSGDMVRLYKEALPEPLSPRNKNTRNNINQFATLL